MESTGIAGKIQVSSSTAELIREAGNQDWLQARDELVEAKGKGSVRTWWLLMKGEGSVVSKTASTSSGTTGITDSAAVSPKTHETEEKSYDV
jgi:hypothetical protein